MITDTTISLRAPEPSDVDALYLWENDRTLWPDGRTRAPLSRHQLWQYIDSYSADPLAEGQARFMIVDEETGESVGTVDLFDIDTVNRRAAVGIFVAPQQRRRGIALRAVKLIAGYCRVELGLRQLWATMAASNTASRSLFKAAGFAVAGRLRSWVRVSPSSYSDAYIMQLLLP